MDAQRTASTNPLNSESTAKALRATILKMIHQAKSGHPGGSLSVLDILLALFGGVVNFRPEEPTWPDRDRVVLSKGHGVPALYAVLAELGYFPKDWLMTLRQWGSPLQGHPDVARMPCVEAATGSLGQGLSIAQGMALANRADGRSNRVFCIMGDGEIQEGQVWEAAMSSPKFKLNNLIAILDYNHGQIDGRSDEVMNLEPLVDKWRSFNWHVEQVDGHDQKAMIDVFSKPSSEKPTFVVAHTVKGKGVSFMEGVIDWHGKATTEEELAKALKELEA